MIWDKLPEETQLSPDIFQFKKEVHRLYKNFDKNFIV